MGVSEVYGTHSGKNLALHFYHALESLELCPKLFCITADNASNNGTLAEELQMKLSQYDAHEHMLGCVGHVMNLAAKAGLKLLGLEDKTTDMQKVVKYDYDYSKQKLLSICFSPPILGNARKETMRLMMKLMTWTGMTAIMVSKKKNQ